MSSQGPLAVGTGADDAAVGTVSWTNPGNITADDGNYATAQSLSSFTSHYLKGTNFGFSIPSGATINGIVMEWKRFWTVNAITDNRVRIIKGGVIGATEMGSGATWASAEQYDSFGSSVSLWGETWTDTDINASTFGCALSCSSATLATANVNFLRATVYYTASGFDPSGGVGAFYRSQTRVLSVWQPNRSGMTAGVLEMTLVTEPTRAFFIKGRGITPPPQRAPGAKAFRPDATPPDQTPTLGWNMQPKGQAPRGPFVPNRSTFAIPMERFPPFPDSWLTVNRRMVPVPARGTPRTWFTLPTDRQPPNPDAWLTATRKGVWPAPRPGQTQTFHVLKPFDFPLQNVTARAPRLQQFGTRAAIAYMRPTDTPLPAVLMGRPVQRIGRGSSWFTLAGEMAQDGELDAARFLMARTVPVTGFRSRSWFSYLPDPTSTGILTLGFLRPLVARPYVTPGQLVGNATRIVWTPQTISTAFRQDNRNARGRSQNDQTGTGLPSRNATGIGNT